MASADLTAARLRELLHYDPDTGLFTWRKSRGRVSAGSIAGTGAPGERVTIRIDGASYLAHRLAWLYMKGAWPALLDHWDVNPSNNRFKNLRESTVALNGQNIIAPRSFNQTGVLGVSAQSAGYGFIARICVDQQQKYLGSFKTVEEASAAYLAAKALLHSHASTSLASPAGTGTAR